MREYGEIDVKMQDPMIHGRTTCTKCCLGFQSLRITIINAAMTATA